MTQQTEMKEGLAISVACFIAIGAVIIGIYYVFGRGDL
jgi:hypothetical protein